MHNFATDIPPIHFEAALNEDQYRAVTSKDGPTLVLAGAGSGKTRTLTYRVAWLLSQGVRPWEILLLTFTNKAANEMLSRVEDLTGVPREKFWGGTFHSIGLRILRANAHLVGIAKTFTILDASDADSLFDNKAKALNPAFFKDRNAPKPRIILDAISYARNTRRPLPEVFAARFSWLSEKAATALLSFAEAYHGAKREQGVCDFDDLMELFLELLVKHPEVCALYQNRFKHILVDEFQDTNKLQGDIVDALAGSHHQVMAVGDDAQCIYTWRGAEFANIADFPTRHPGASIHKIEINYRSTPEILNFANGILAMQDLESGFSKTLRPVRPSGRKPMLIPALDSTEQALFVAHCVRGLVEDGRDPAEITILYRAHYQAMELQMELTRMGIPFVITSGIRFFEQAHVRDMVAHLRIIQNPEDEIAFSRLLALLPNVGPKTAARLHGLTLAEARKHKIRFTAALNTPAVTTKAPKQAHDDFAALALTLQNMDIALHGTAAQATDAQGDFFQATEHTPQALGEPIIQKTPMEVLRIGLEGWYAEYMRSIYVNWQERRDDLNNLLNFASKFSDIGELLAQLTLLSSETSERSTEPNNYSLRLTTVHQAKGLEFPVVFIIGCADGLFPLKRAIERDDVSEERRLFYVAATRAMDELYCVYPKLVRMGNSTELLETSRFILELPSDSYLIRHIQRAR
jgi:DNA helicase-2/ATP-dependent DNA helicase PcrA